MRQPLILVSIGLLIGIGGSALYLFGLEAGWRLELQRDLQALDALTQVEEALWKGEPLSEAEIEAVSRLPGGKGIEVLLRRFAEGIETEADRRQLGTQLSYLKSTLQDAIRLREAKRYRWILLWFLGLMLVSGMLVASGFWLQQRALRERQEALLSIQEVLHSWAEGNWEILPPQGSTLRSDLQELQPVLRASQVMVESLARGETRFALPEGRHPLLHQWRALQQSLQKHWDLQSQQALLMRSLASFSEILKESQTIAQLAERTIALLCRELNVHMGALFVRRGDVLTLEGSYAYDLSSGRGRQFHLGEGFVGQVALEKKILRIHPVPPSYLRLRSGLGEASPHTLLLLPLIFQEESYGVVELASLEAVPPLMEPFLQKTSEHIGAAVANFISREKLTQLLEEEQNLRRVLEEKQKELLRSTELMEEAQHKLIESQTRLTSQISAIRSAALVVELDAGGRILFANDAFLTATGYVFSRLQHTFFNEWVGDHDLAISLQEALAQSRIWQGLVPIRASSGGLLWLRLTLAPLQGMETAGYIGICFDSTREKAQEEELRRMLEQTLAQEEQMRETNRQLQSLNEELLRTQTELRGQIAAVGNSAIVSETDLQGRIIRVNELFLQIYGYKTEEVLGQNHRILKSGHQSDEVFEEMWATITQGKVWRGEVRNRSKTGQYYWILLTITPVLSAEGKVLKYIGVGFDITAQKRQEEELRSALELSRTQQQELRLYTQQLQAAHEEMRRTQVELRGQINAVHNAAIVAETDPEGRITFVNDAFCAISGYTREELLGGSHAILRSGKHDEAFYQELRKTLTDKKVWSGIFCNRRKDGSLYWIKSTITPVLDTRGKLVKYIAVSFDLTAQIQQEEALRQAQSELIGQIIAVGNAAYLMETDLEGRLLYANPAALETWGYTWAEVQGQTLRFLQSGHHPPSFWEEMWDTLKKGQVWQAEVLNKSRSGDLFWQLLTITPIRDANGNLYKYIGVAFDITAQKRQAERIRSLLQESQEYAKELGHIQSELLRTQLELIGRINALNNAAVVLETSVSGEITFVNDEATYLWGYSREALIGRGHLSLYEGVATPRQLERLQDRLQSGFVWQGELPSQTAKGETLWLQLTITPVQDETGNIYKYIVVGFDITRQKVQAQRLKEVLQLLEQGRGESTMPAHESLPWFLTDKRGFVQAVSPALLRLMEYPMEAILGKPARVFRSPSTPNHVFLDLWSTILQGKPWYGFLYNRTGQGSDLFVFLAIFPHEKGYLSLLFPVDVACELLRAKWMSGYIPSEVLQDYQLMLEARNHEIYELRQILQKLLARSS
ncbi:MAG: PAS domain S-box protein [Bacteroidia bacterium]|nr:PAS domain S-box protein [Bacteroidia bacterium]MDW8236474.1 PAS domain S-box protein [Bacteroidia bacterium]